MGQANAVGPNSIQGSLFDGQQVHGSAQGGDRPSLLRCWFAGTIATYVVAAPQAFACVDDAFIYSKFRQNLFKSSGTTAVEICPFPSFSLLAFTAACTTIQTLIFFEKEPINQPKYLE